MADNQLPHIVTTSPDDLMRAAQALRDGAIVAVPTETVYGLAARADSVDAVARSIGPRGGLISTR
jgi:L-threonylcarbamoyladenylate synthase